MDVLRAVGKPLALQLVVDALKLTSANPSFLNMRDAIIAAATPLAAATGMDGEHTTELLRTLWAAFARHGLGPKATSNGAQLTGITGDFSPPADPVPTAAAVPADATPPPGPPPDQPPGPPPDQPPGPATPVAPGAASTGPDPH